MSARALRGQLARARWQVAAAAVTLALVWLVKRFYSHATAEELAPILAPTARLVSWVSGGAYVYERGAGWVSYEHAFIIAPACAGVNFALAALLVLMGGGLARVRSGGALLRRLLAAVVAAYVTTLLVNTTRIVIAIALHHGALRVGQLDAGELHRAEGIAVYLVGLCALHLGAQAAERALARRRVRSRRRVRNCVRQGAGARRVLSGEILVTVAP